MKEVRNKFSKEFKIKVAGEVLAGKITKEAARRIYGIRGKSAVTDWVRFYRYQIPDKVKDDGAPERIDITLPAMKKQVNDITIEELQGKIRELERQLTTETQRAGLYATMIEIAEEQLHISIKKKFGAKRWNNTKSGQKK
jgi:transposase-like protein